MKRLLVNDYANGFNHLAPFLFPVTTSCSPAALPLTKRPSSTTGGLTQANLRLLGGHVDFLANQMITRPPPQPQELFPDGTTRGHLATSIERRSPANWQVVHD